MNSRNHFTVAVRYSSFAVFTLTAMLLATFCAALEKSVPSPQGAPAVTVKLAADGRSLVPIRIAATATDREKAIAKTLAEYLQRITGAAFSVETFEGVFSADTPAIAIGTGNRFAKDVNSFKSGDDTASEDYLLRSQAHGLLIVGASELAVEHAVWDLLYRIGYRQFFPGKTWEVVPAIKNLDVAVNTLEHPDYYARRIWFGYGALPENQQEYEEWNARNRATAGIALNTGHSYGLIILRNKAEFEKHPEYLTQPGVDKFCVSNPGLRQLVIQDALNQFEKNPQLQSVSLDPSDGGGWESDSCPDGKEFKSVTDRVIFLANTVAEAVTQKYPDKFVGVYAYNEHSPPPTIQVHPHVVVSIATGFIRGGYSVDQLLSSWNAKASMLGIREYYSVNPWDRDLPGRARGGNLDYLRSSLKQFHDAKARFMSAESGDNWGPNGFGYYAASRMMWNVDEAKSMEALKQDFLTRAFGSASEAMAEFYQLIDGANRPLLSSDLIGRMYRLLDKAFKALPDASVQSRLRDLTLYTRYIELYNKYERSSGVERQAAFETVMRFAWRIRRTHMVHTVSMWRDLPARDPAVRVPEGADYFVAAPGNPWKSNEAFNDEDIARFIAAGVANNEIINFKAIAFSSDLVPATPLKLPATTKPGHYFMQRGDQDFYTWVEKTPATIDLKVQAGLIYNIRGDAKFFFYPLAETMGASVSAKTVVPDKADHELHFETKYSGLHRLSVSDGGSGTHLEWAPGVPMTVESTVAKPLGFGGGRWSLYFYVPKGTKVVGGYRNGQGWVLDGDGKIALKLEAAGNPGYWSIPVAPGQDGKVWMLQNISGQAMLMTIPPQLALTAQELLLPREVVEADTSR